MVANVNAAPEPPDPGLKTNRNAAAAASPPAQSGSSAPDATNNVLVDSIFDRANDLSSSTPDRAEDILDGQSADQYTEYARASILERPASAMAAQANQLPQSVLQLLQ